MEKEFPCEWTCPACGTHQHDSVHPELGPFVTCTCTNCTKTFAQTDLSVVDQQSWDDAVTKAEAVTG
jgi:hypothetical protein